VSAYERKAQRDIHGVVESQRLDRDQRLVVIHAQSDVVIGARLRMEHGIRRNRTPGIDTLRGQPRNGGRDDGIVLFSQRAVLAGMRIEPGDGQPRTGKTKPRRKIARHDAAGSTTRSLESCLKISLSGRWIVTGTTASSGDHSIITGRTDLPVASCTSVARNSVWPGSANPQL